MRVSIALALLGIGIGVAASADHLLDVYMIPSDSMRPTLERGDIVLCARDWAFERGDLVVFMHPGEQQWAVKRIVGLPGDTLSYTRKSLVVNGEISPKEFVRKLDVDDAMDEMSKETVSGVAFPILESYGAALLDVPERSLEGYFLLGDNRDGSNDSRQSGEIAGSSIRCRLVALLATERTSGFELLRARLL